MGQLGVGGGGGGGRGGKAHPNEMVKKLCCSMLYDVQVEKVVHTWVYWIYRRRGEGFQTSEVECTTTKTN